MKTLVFNNKEALIEGWYWLLRADDLRPGQVRAVTLMGRELAIYRGTDGKVVAMDAYCPHMGAHLAEGRVEGTDLRCFFHHWKYDAQGRCTEIPALGQGCPSVKARVRTWPVEEQHGLIWLWTGVEARHPVPTVPELQGQQADWMLGSRFTKNCHPNVLLINAIDEHHFASVHRLPVPLYMEAREVHENCIEFGNTTRVPQTSLFTRFLSRFYRGPLTYAMSYWYGSTGTVTLGPDFLHFHILFALRPTREGRTEGQTILITKKRPGPGGYLINRVLLRLTQFVGAYFANGDTKVFQTIRFDLKTPIPADHAILDFIRHTECQKTAVWLDQERPATEPREVPSYG